MAPYSCNRWEQYWSVVKTFSYNLESHSFSRGSEKKAHKITYFFDGVQQGEPVPINAPTNIKYIGNSKDRRESIGRIADLRVYPYILKDSNILEIYNILQTYEEDGD